MNWLRSKNTWRASAALAGLLALAACDKGTDLGVDLPEVADINARFLDLPLGVSTVQYDSVETLKSDHFLAGRLTDGVAGTTTAQAVLNLQASTRADSLPGKYTNPVLDSVIFVQGFDAVYGSSSGLAVFDLLKLRNPLSETESYTSASAPDAPDALASNLTSRLDRIVRIKNSDTTNRAIPYLFVPDPTLRLTLFNPTKGVYTGYIFANQLFGQMKKTSPVFGQAQLTPLLAGLVLVPSAGYDGAILSLNRNRSNKLTFYFHGKSLAVPKDTLLKRRSYSINFGPSPNGSGAGSANDPRYYTYLKSDKTGTRLAPLAQVDGAAKVLSTALDNLSYVQDGIGLGTRLEFESRLAPLRALRNVAINRAELFVPVKPFATALWPNVNGLFLLEVNENNQVLQRISGLTSVGRIVQRSGSLQTGVNNEALALLYDAKTAAPYFSVDITNYLQAYLSSQLDGPLPAALVLLPTVRRSQNLTLNRTVLDAGGAGRAPRLRVYYSELR